MLAGFPDDIDVTGVLPDCELGAHWVVLVILTIKSEGPGDPEIVIILILHVTDIVIGEAAEAESAG